MPILDLQRRGQQIGRIRIGQQVQGANGKMRPVKLDTFRFTTASRVSADAIAELYGGTVRDWQGQFEVVTGQSAIGVTIPPRDQIVSQWYEMWNKGGCLRRCDSRTEQISGGRCQCPHADNPDDAAAVEAAALERSRLASANPPRACKLVTRISVMIPDLPGLGVFRLDTGSYYAATEIGDSGELMHLARSKGVFLPAMLRIEQRTRVAGGQTKNYPVPVLEVLVTFRDIVSGAIAAAGIAGQLPPAPGGGQRAIGGAAKAIEAPAAPEGDAQEKRAGEAQRIAALAAQATSRKTLHPLIQLAKAQKLGPVLVCTDQAHDVWEELAQFLNDLWGRFGTPEGDGDE
jgi:Recombination directionality factor-like